MEIRSLSAVILRRNISASDVDVADLTDSANNDNLWNRLSFECRNAIKTSLIQVLGMGSSWPKAILHKVCSLAVEVQGAMQSLEEKEIWNELLACVNQLIGSGNETLIDAAL